MNSNLKQYSYNHVTDWTSAVHSVTFSPTSIPTGARSSDPPLFSAFPHHARTGIKGRP